MAVFKEIVLNTPSCYVSGLITVNKESARWFAFIDIPKVYDQVPRGKFFLLLMSLGCGQLCYAQVTSCYLKLFQVTSCCCNNPTSVFLFIIYVDTVMKMVKERSPYDSFIMWLHPLMLMDDIGILATSRASLDISGQKNSVMITHSYRLTQTYVYEQTYTDTGHHLI